MKAEDLIVGNVIENVLCENLNILKQEESE